MRKALPGAAGVAALGLLAWATPALPQPCPPGYACAPSAYAEPYAARYPNPSYRPTPAPSYTGPYPTAPAYQPGPWDNSSYSYKHTGGG